MKIKLKTAEGLVDPNIEIVDGVMVVSPKKVKFEPKDGDVVFSGASLISVFKKMTSDTSFSAYVALSNGKLHAEFNNWSTLNIRPATEEEKKKLFDKLAEEGFEWNADKKELVKLKWKPKEEETYYCPWMNSTDDMSFFLDTPEWEDDGIDEMLYNKGWCFKTKEELLKVCGV